MKKKKLTAALLTTVLAASALLSACGSSSASSSAGSSGSSSTAASSTSAVESESAASASGSSASSAAETSSESESAEATGVVADQVNIAIQPSAAFVPLFVAKENGWIEEALEEYGVEVVWNSFESGPPMNESLASGDSDIGVIGDVPTVSAIASGQDNVVVATTAKAADSYAVLVSPDSDIETAEDLVGKKVATVVGSTGHNLVRKYLEASDLSLDDVELVNISAGDAATVLSTGSVDAVAIWEPNVTRLTENGTAKIIAEGSDVGLAGTNTMVARREFAEANPEIVSVIVEQYQRAADELDSIDDETLAKVAEYLSLETDQLKTVITKFQYTVVPDQDDIDSLNDTISFLYDIDAISEEYDITPYVDSSYAE